MKTTIVLTTDLKHNGQRHSRGSVLELAHEEALDLIQSGAARHQVAVLEVDDSVEAAERQAIIDGLKKATGELTADNRTLRAELDRVRRRKQDGAGDAAQLRDLRSRVAELEGDIEEAEGHLGTLRTQNDTLQNEKAALASENDALRTQVELLQQEKEEMVQTMQQKAIGSPAPADAKPADKPKPEGK